jgi:hypothetical protein
MEKTDLSIYGKSKAQIDASENKMTDQTKCLKLRYCTNASGKNLKLQNFGRTFCP